MYPPGVHKVYMPKGYTTKPANLCNNGSGMGPKSMGVMGALSRALLIAVAAFGVAERPAARCRSPKKFASVGAGSSCTLHTVTDALMRQPLQRERKKGARFLPRARAQIQPRAGDIPDGKICPGFALRRSHPHSALPSFVWNVHRPERCQEIARLG
jgi:hypothetical protein